MKKRPRFSLILTILLLFVHTQAVVFAQETQRIVHVFVALCDNEHQGIVPVSTKLGNGDEPKNNLYWGAMYGIKTFFTKSPHWELLVTISSPSPAPRQTRWKWLSRLTNPTNPVLERCIFRHTTQRDVYLVADAYQGRQIKQAIIDFLDAASGTSSEIISIQHNDQSITLNIHGGAHLLGYVGHDGLMDFQLRRYPVQQDERYRETMILACISQKYFYEPIIQSGATPVLWTTGLMAPEAYTLESALEGWVLRENHESIRLRAAKAYNKYQQCGLNAAKRLLVTGM